MSTISLDVAIAKRWKSMLEEETESIPLSQAKNHPAVIVVEELHDLIDSVNRESLEKKKELDKLREEAKQSQQGGLTFAEVEVNQVYKFRSMAGLKQYLVGKRVEITKKKIKNVSGVLLESAGRYKAGTSFSVDPNSLEKC